MGEALDNGVYDALCATAASSPATCNFSQMVPLFQELFEPDPARLTALIGRVRILLKLGVAGGGRTTKGKTAAFTAEDVWQITVTMELTEMGLPPSKAIEIFDAFLFDGEVEGPMEVTRARSTIELDIPFIEGAMARHLPDLFAPKDDVWPEANAQLRKLYAQFQEPVT